jgi:hypothetical protein
MRAHGKMIPSVFCSATLLLAALSGCATTGDKPPCDPKRTHCPPSQVTPTTETASAVPVHTAQADYGIEVVSLRLSAEGNLLDLRYRVLDPAKASSIFDRKNDAYLIDDASGKRLTVPTMAKVGPLRQTNFKPDPNRVYFILFGNPGGLVDSGSAVTLEVGDCRIENLVVQ